VGGRARVCLSACLPDWDAVPDLSCPSVRPAERACVWLSVRQCLDKAIAMVKPGTRYRDLGEAISRHAEAAGFSVVRSYCGHGIADLFHCAPNIPHYARNKVRGGWCCIRPSTAGVLCACFAVARPH
jgi:methionine aminopeptidase